MPSELDRLGHVRDNCLFALELVQGLTAETLANDRTKLYATIRCLEIISEASRHLSAEFKNRHTALPWTQIAGAGNVYRHDYIHVRPDRILNTVNEALPPLLAAVESELAR
jgi:uncharacterized protein with HEPN domain